MAFVRKSRDFASITGEKVHVNQVAGRTARNRTRALARRGPVPPDPRRRRAALRPSGRGPRPRAGSRNGGALIRCRLDERERRVCLQARFVARARSAALRDARRAGRSAKLARISRAASVSISTSLPACVTSGTRRAGTTSSAPSTRSRSNVSETLRKALQGALICGASADRHRVLLAERPALSAKSGCSRSRACWQTCCSRHTIHLRGAKASVGPRYRAADRMDDLPRTILERRRVLDAPAGARTRCVDVALLRTYVGRPWRCERGRWRRSGRWFTWHVEVQEAQRLVVTGPYRFVRHPQLHGCVRNVRGRLCAAALVDGRSGYGRAAGACVLAPHSATRSACSPQRCLSMPTMRGVSEVSYRSGGRAPRLVAESRPPAAEVAVGFREG